MSSPAVVFLIPCIVSSTVAIFLNPTDLSSVRPCGGILNPMCEVSRPVAVFLIPCEVSGPVVVFLNTSEFSSHEVVFFNPNLRMLG